MISNKMKYYQIYLMKLKVDITTTNYLLNLLPYLVVHDRKVHTIVLYN